VGDGYLLQLDTVAREMHQRISSSAASEADVQRWKGQIFAINDGVTPAAKAFSDALGEGSRVILRLLLVTNLATALVLIAWRCCALTNCWLSAMPLPMPCSWRRSGRRLPCNPSAMG